MTDLEPLLQSVARLRASVRRSCEESRSLVEHCRRATDRLLGTMDVIRRTADQWPRRPAGARGDPAARGPANAPPRPEDAAPGLRTVLIVDDSPDFCSTLAMLVRLAGYEAAVCRDGREALDYLRTHPPPGVIVLDLRMPGMDGYRFCALQRSDPALAHIPVVVCSGETAPKERAELGHAAFCRKGSDPEDLLRLIRDRCRWRAPARGRRLRGRRGARRCPG